MLVQELLIAKRDLKLSKQIKKYAQFEGMIIDDLGYIRQTREEMEVVFTLLAERYERGSVLLNQQSSVLEVGRNFQRSNDDGGRHRSPGASQHHHRTKHSQLSS
jgi:DNA replication protein DnaC